MIQIVNQKIFVNGKETTDPVLIGYSIIDFAENKEEGDLTLATHEELLECLLKTKETHRDGGIST